MTTKQEFWEKVFCAAIQGSSVNAVYPDYLIACVVTNAKKTADLAVAAWESSQNPNNLDT